MKRKRSDFTGKDGKNEKSADFLQRAISVKKMETERKRGKRQRKEDAMWEESLWPEAAEATKASLRKELLQSALFLLLSGKPHSEEGWTKAEKTYFARAADAIRILGKESASVFLSEGNEKETDAILAGLLTLRDGRERKKRGRAQLEEAERNLPEAVRGKSLLFFWQLYQAWNPSEQCPLRPDPERTAADLVAWAEEVFAERGADLHTEEVILRFGKWLRGADLIACCRRFFNLNLLGTPRFYEVLRLRSEGVTLQEIGQKYGVTRERIRQMERRGVNVLARRVRLSRYPLLGLISAYRQGDRVLRKEEIEAEIGREYGNLLWYLATMGNGEKGGFLLDSPVSHYGEADGAVIVGNADRTDQAAEKRARIRERLLALPEILRIDDLYADMKKLAKEIPCEEEVCFLAAENCYGFRGRYACRGRFTKSKMCEEVLRRKFPDGFKVSDKKAIAAFHNEWENCFGEPLDMTDRALIAKISDMGVLCDRGKYIHRDYIHFEAKQLEPVYDYIRKSPKRAIPYAEIFTALAPVFEGTAIRNRFLLRGVMKLYHAPYASDRDYLFKDRTGNIVYELTRFVTKRGCAEKADILAAFPGWKEYNIAFVTARCPEVISLGAGRYLHAGRLSTVASETEAMREFLQETVRGGAVTSKTLLTEISTHFSDFVQRNQIKTPEMLFGILRYLFSDSLDFLRPYVSAKAN